MDDISHAERPEIAERPEVAAIAAEPQSRPSLATPYVVTWDVAVVGAGAAGLIAAERAAARGLRTILLEKNRKPGVKILMSGGTRCNLTQNTDRAGIIKAFGKQQGKFLHSALAAMGPKELVALVEAEGVPTKIEPTGKIFPASNKAADILRAFVQRLERTLCTFRPESPLQSLTRDAESFVLQTPGETLRARCVILTTGGKSYPGCGTCGDGYPWAEAFGHTIVPLKPALTPITVPKEDVLPLQGLTLPVGVRVVELDAADRPNLKKPLAETRNSLLFAHFGLTGPAALDPSRAVSTHPTPQRLRVLLDFLPDTTLAALEEHFREAASLFGRRLIEKQLPEDLPQRLASEICRRAAIPEDRTAATLSKAERARLIAEIKSWTAVVTGTLGYAKAEVTAGGIDLREVDSSTLQSKKVPGLYFAGEILDLDGPIGGYNFQAAFSTGLLAGERVMPAGRTRVDAPAEEAETPAEAVEVSAEETPAPAATPAD